MNIFVAKLSFETTSESLREAFEAFGEVDSAKVIMDHETGKSRGFGFVEMPNDDEAQAALDALNEQEFEGNTIVCKKAEPRKDDGGGRGGFGGGGGRGGYGGGGGGYGGNRGGGGGYNSSSTGGYNSGGYGDRNSGGSGYRDRSSSYDNDRYSSGGGSGSYLDSFKDKNNDTSSGYSDRNSTSSGSGYRDRNSGGGGYRDRNNDSGSYRDRFNKSDDSYEKDYYSNNDED